MRVKGGDDEPNERHPLANHNLNEIAETFLFLKCLILYYIISVYDIFLVYLISPPKKKKQLPSHQ